MKKVLRIFAILLGLLFILVLIAIKNGYIVLDHSGRLQGNCLYWNGSKYIFCAGEYSEGKTIAKTRDGWRINKVKEDDTHTFLVIRSFLDQYLMVKDSYEIPTSGEISVVVWRHTIITDPDFCGALADILENLNTASPAKVVRYVDLPNEVVIHEVNVGFDTCPVAAIFVDCLWKQEENWYIAARNAADDNPEESGQDLLTLSCYPIPRKYYDLLETYHN